MRRVVFALSLFTAAAHAASVTVVHPDGKPAARATALCVEPASADPLIVSAGRVDAPDGCRRLRCDAPGFLPGEIDLAGEAPRCVLQPATVVTGELAGAAAAAGLEARLFAVGKGNAPVVRLAVPKAGEGRKTAKFALPPVRPGRYTLQLWRGSDGWSCRADLGPLGPGTARLIAGWHEPVSVPIKVKLPDGKPAAGVGIRAWSQRPVMSLDREMKVPFGTWACRWEAPSTVATDHEGRASFGVDLAQETLIVAGDFKNPRGLAYTILDRAPSEAVSMTLSPPVIVKAKIEDERERPVPCDVELQDLVAEVAWIARVAGGSTIKSVCDPQGTVMLGPIPATSFTLDVLPKPGLPMRVTVDAPTAGTTVDLGVLRVRNGEKFRVVVSDELSNPVAAAKVMVRGSAGVVLSVDGVTGTDGAADLVGLPKNASVTVEVTAKGFLPVLRRQLELDASPLAIKLTRGGAVSGTVLDRDAGGIEGATVYLQGTSDRRDTVTTDARGAFGFDGVEDGSWRIHAAARGYATSAARTLEVREHVSVDDVTIELVASDGITGRVVDAAGAPVAGAQVRQYVSGQRADLNRSPPTAEATSGANGEFEVQGERTAVGWLTATKPGYGPCAVRSSDGPANEDIVLALTDPASLIVRLSRGARPSRPVGVRDGAGLRRTMAAAAGAELTFTDLAPGRGSVQLGEGEERGVILIARQTTEITLEAGSAIEGRVTFENAPAARTFVSAVRERDGGQLSGRDGSFTDDRGRYRIDGLDAGTYRLVAVGEDGRAETPLTLTDGETAHADLALRSVRLVVIATDGADDRPIAGLPLSVAPAGAECSSSMGSSSWNEPGELGFDIMVGSGGCVSGRTDAAGVARLSLASPGSYDLMLANDVYENWSQPIALGEGTTTKRVALTRKPDKSGDKPRLIANLLTDPPGMLGRVECRSGGNVNSSSPVMTRHDCGEVLPGPAEVSFHVEGFGRGRTVVNVPASGEHEVDVVVVRGGTLIVPVTEDSTQRPLVVDGSGFAWSDGTPDARMGGAFEGLPSGGRAWVFRDVPPGTYTVTVGGKARPPVPVSSGATAYAN